MSTSLCNGVLAEKIKQYRDDSYVYKSCNDRWIVVLQKQPDTRTNEQRPLQFGDPKYAKYRADKLQCIEIFDKFDPTTTTTQCLNTEYDNAHIVYVTGTTIYPDKFDNTLTICSNGLHYFKSIERAYYYGFQIPYTGYYIGWTEDGCKRYEGHYVDNLKSGKWIYYHDNGQILAEGNHTTGKKSGKWTHWYNDGHKSAEGEYDKKSGRWIGWLHDGQKKYEQFYIDGQSDEPIDHNRTQSML